MPKNSHRARAAFDRLELNLCYARKLIQMPLSPPPVTPLYAMSGSLGLVWQTIQEPLTHGRQPWLGLA